VIHVLWSMKLIRFCASLVLGEKAHRRLVLMQEHQNGSRDKQYCTSPRVVSSLFRCIVHWIEDRWLMSEFMLCVVDDHFDMSVI
jgi:hypothetical protein